MTEDKKIKLITPFLPCSVLLQYWLLSALSMSDQQDFNKAQLEFREIEDIYIDIFDIL